MATRKNKKKLTEGNRVGRNLETKTGLGSGVPPVETSYTPIDVGFDLRRHPDMSIELPAGERLRVSYGDEGRKVEGTRVEVARVLRKAGYRVVAN